MLRSGTRAVQFGDWQGHLAVFKYVERDKTFEKEFEAYEKLKGCDFTPKLFHVDRSQKLFVLENVGVDVQTKYKPCERKKFLPLIKEMDARLSEIYGIHHNDIHWKNVTQNSEGSLFIIDFGRWTPANKPRVFRKHEVL